MKYPRHPKDIFIEVTFHEIQDGMITEIHETVAVSLGEKLSDYFMRLGYTNAHVVGLITQLLTQLKVRVDFRDYSERLELKNEMDRLTFIQAATLLDDYATELGGGKVVAAAKITQIIKIK